MNLSIKDVPEALAERLRARAARNHRSLQRELMAIVERAVGEPTGAPEVVTSSSSPGSPGATAERPSTIAFTRRGTKTIEQIATEHRKLYPQPFRDVPRAVDIIREDRDER